jgi:small-conductance mechanosensitive channel
MTSAFFAAWIGIGPNGALQVFGIRLVGVNAENGQKLALSLLFIACLYLLSRAAAALIRLLTSGRGWERAQFWLRQAVHVATAAILVIGLVSIWFDDPARLGTVVGLVTAGLAFALQRVVTAVAGYLLILRGKTFNVGDRITMGGVRGDVIALGFLQTTIMEMGQPPAVQNADPAMWVRARQYSGRIVTVTNAKVFDEPVFNYTKDFPFLWEEISLPIPYDTDRRRAEAILVAAADAHTADIAHVSEEHLRELERRYFVRRAEMRPRAYLRLTDNWIELTVRFIVEDHKIREVKDAMARQILDEFQAAGIEVASATSAIVQVPPLRVHIDRDHGPPTRHATGQNGAARPAAS